MVIRKIVEGGLDCLVHVELERNCLIQNKNGNLLKEGSRSMVGHIPIAIQGELRLECGIVKYGA